MKGEKEVLIPAEMWKESLDAEKAEVERLEAELAVANGELAVTTKRLDRIETWLTERGVVPIDAPENVGNGTHGHIKERLERLVTQEQAKGREQERETTRRLREALESLLQRLRPGSEAAPWVIEELKALAGTEP